MKRRWTRRLALGAGTLLACVLLVEAVYRVYVYGWGGLSPTLMESVLTLSRSDILQENEDPELRFELRPNHHRLYKMVDHQTNSRGLRDREYTLEKPADTVRIAVIGDSWTMGLGVEQPDIYHEVLERRLNQDSSSTKYECINFGVAAYGLPEYAASIRMKALAYDPDLILIGLTATDKSRTPGGVFKARPADNPFWEFHALDAAWWAVVEMFGGRVTRARFAPMPNTLSVGVLHEPGASDDPLPVPDDPVPPQEWPDALPAEDMEFIREGFARLAELGEANDVPIFMALLTQSDTANERGNRNSQAFRKVAAEVGLPYFDTRQYLGGRELHDCIIFKNDTHPNAEVHALLADAIYDQLKAGPWLDP